MFNSIFIFFTKEIILFLILGLVLGRLGSILVEAFSQFENSKKTNKDFSFFLQCCHRQKGFIPLFWPLKKTQQTKYFLRPFIIELLITALFVSLFYFIGWKFLLLEYIIFVFALVVASAIDIEHYILPNSLTLSGIVIGLVGALLNPEYGREFWPALAGVFTGGGFFLLVALFYYTIRKEEGLGGGDIKLLAWIGAVLSWQSIPVIIVLSSFIGMFASIVMGIFGVFKIKNYLKTYIPFGPYLSCAALIYIFYGEELVHWYLNVL